MDWINFDVIAREPFLVDILKLVYLHFVPAAVLRQSLYNDDKFMKNKQCLDIYIDALHCHAIEEVKATRPRRPRYQRYSAKENKFLVTFRYRMPMYYEHEEDKWLPLPGCKYPPGQIKKCTSTLTTIYALVKTTDPYDPSEYYAAEVLAHRNQLWEYSCQSNEWKLYVLPTNEPDDLVYLQGTLYVMENKRMWKMETDQWKNCESCAHNCTTSFAFGKYIIRFGASNSKKTFYCSLYDVNKMTYTQIVYKMPKPVIVQKAGVQSVMMIDGSVYNWHKWAKYCISNNEIMDSTSGAAFLIPQDDIPLQQSNRTILLKDKLHYVVGQTVFLPNTEHCNSASVCRNITNLKKKHKILPGDKNIVFVSLVRECFRPID
ncbi:uncharacterized protein LOC117100604 [Anneissia japonica]|uniref:uncharacterized protein LOC117100604 n=1 Tax=Anneissia japonica TaxID=1529436 RepID=UPI001425B95A|nr:uncharacterized protein LOC117100604 [Anneissia japonica]